MRIIIFGTCSPARCVAPPATNLQCRCAAPMLDCEIRIEAEMDAKPHRIK